MTAVPERIGFVGLGNMGEKLARRLAAAVTPLVVFDVNPKPVEQLVECGAQAAASIAEIAARSSIVFLSLPTPASVRAVGSELIGCGTSGLAIVDMSTTDPGTIRSLSELAEQRQMHVIDAPVSGGPSRAATGELTIMVGGDAETLARTRPFLNHMGRHVFEVGPTGSGSLAKLLNNFVATWTGIGVSQAFHVADRFGLPADKLYEVMSKSSGSSYTLDRNFPKLSKKDYTPYFSLELAAKDMFLGLDAAEQAGMPMLCADEIRALFNRALKNGQGHLDMAALHEWLGLPGADSPPTTSDQTETAT